MAFCGSAAGLLAAAAGQLLVEAFQTSFGLVIEAVWVNVWAYMLTDSWPIATPLHFSCFCHDVLCVFVFFLIWNFR